MAYLFPVFTLPEPTGSYAIGTASYHLVDRSCEESYTDDKGDHRELMITVWYPADPDTAAKLPRKPYPKEVAEAMSLVFRFLPSCSDIWTPFRPIRWEERSVPPPGPTTLLPQRSMRRT
ncbi:hypothetical protein ABU162_04120 [Paenibacillus thiaminolyticus]|uniref:hypothetical protein n=1 Tax=Paenibacillus thiaminolyticus TaxID=49283 RepID=UPI0035A746A1